MSAILLEWRFRADPRELAGLRARVGAVARALPWSAQAAAQFVLAVNEACMNVMEHAYGGDRSGEIAVEILDNGGVIEVVVTDFAAPVDFNRIRPRDLEDLRPGDWARLMREIMDECTYAISRAVRGTCCG